MMDFVERRKKDMYDSTRVFNICTYRIDSMRSVSYNIQQSMLAIILLTIHKILYKMTPPMATGS